MTGPAKPRGIALSPRLSGATALEAVARATLAHADANEPFVQVEGDREGLHQFRVGYRRLRSLFSLARDVVRVDPEAARIKARLRELTVALGPARDLDVFLEAHPDLTEEDSRRLDAARVAAYGQAHAFLDSPERHRLRADLDRWLDARGYREVLGHATWTGRASAARALERRWRRILADGAHLADLDAHARHLVRIEAKKVRYGSQFFGSLWPRATAQAALIEKLLGALQDRLGALNDAVTWTGIEQLAGLVDAQPPEVDVAAEVAAAQEIVDRLATITPYWRVSLRPKPKRAKAPASAKAPKEKSAGPAKRVAAAKAGKGRSGKGGSGKGKAVKGKSTAKATGKARSVAGTRAKRARRG